MPSRRPTRSRAAEAAAPPEKRAHALHESTSDVALIDALGAAGVDLDALLGPVVVDPAAVSVLVVGSLAEHLAGPASDVDLLVLADSPADRLVMRDGVVYSDAATVELRSYEHGLELNTEVAFRSEMRSVVGAFLELAPILYQPGAPVRFPRLERRQLRLLHRLRTGIVWRGPERVEMWRDELYTQLLPPYVTLASVIELDRRFEQALAAADRPVPALAMAGRRVGEAALLAGLASAGFTNPSITAALELAARVEDPAVKALLDLAVHTIFPTTVMDDDGGAGYLAQLAALRDAVGARVAALGLDRAAATLTAQSPVVLT